MGTNFCNVLGNESGKWFLDLKNGNGACGKGEASTPADSTFVMKDEHFQQMFAGKKQFWNLRIFLHLDFAWK